MWLKALISVVTVLGISFSSLAVANSDEMQRQIADHPKGNQQTNIGATETGKQAFKAIYFGTGPEASKLQKNLNLNQYLSNSLRAKHTELSEDDQYRVQVDLVVDELSQKNPEFFTTFGEGIQSGDPKKVEQTVDSGFDYLDQQVEEQGTAPNIDGRANPTSLVALIAAAVWALVVWDAAVAVNYAVALNVEGHVNVHQKTNFSVSEWGQSNQKILNGEGGSIPKERAIAGVLKTFTNQKSA